MQGIHGRGTYRGGIYERYTERHTKGYTEEYITEEEHTMIQRTHGRGTCGGETYGGGTNGGGTYVRRRDNLYGGGTYEGHTEEGHMIQGTCRGRIYDTRHNYIYGGRDICTLGGGHMNITRHTL